jgi:hypothetical protein
MLFNKGLELFDLYLYSGKSICKTNRNHFIFINTCIYLTTVLAVKNFTQLTQVVGNAPTTAFDSSNNGPTHVLALNKGGSPFNENLLLGQLQMYNLTNSEHKYDPYLIAGLHIKNIIRSMNDIELIVLTSLETFDNVLFEHKTTNNNFRETNMQYLFSFSNFKTVYIKYENILFGRAWLKFTFMVLPYGGGVSSRRKSIESYLRSTLNENILLEFAQSFCVENSNDYKEIVFDGLLNIILIATNKYIENT